MTAEAISSHTPFGLTCQVARSTKEHVVTEVDQISEKDKAIAEYLGQVVIARLIDAASNKEMSAKIIDTWAGEFQRIVGRVVIRTVLWICGVVLFIAAIKLGIAEKIAHFLQVPK